MAIQAKLADSVFMKGADPDLSVVDSYGRTPKEINVQLKNSAQLNIQHYLDNFSGGLGGLLGGLNLDRGFLSGVGGGLKKFESTIKDAVKKGQDLAKQGQDIYDRVGKPLMQSYNSIMQIREDIKQDALGALSKFAGGLGDGGLGGLISDGVNIYRVAKETDFKDLGSLLNGVSKLTGTDLLGKYIDIQAEVAWASAFVREAMNLGNHEAITALRKMVGGSKYFKDTVATQVQYTAQGGDIDTLEEVLHILDGRMILAKNPNIINDILKNYKLPDNYKYDDFQKYRQQIVTVLMRIDPNWDQEVFNGEVVTKTEPWIAASADTKKLFGELDKYDQVIHIAGSYPEMTTVQALRSTYPLLYL